MKIISLNTWGGKLFAPLLRFIKSQSSTVDIFCFQEVFSSPTKKNISRSMRANLYEELTKSLPNFKGYFAPSYKKSDTKDPVDFPISHGLSVFVRKSYKVDSYGNVFIYGNLETWLKTQNLKRLPRNLLYITLIHKDKRYLISHFHGIWYPKTKKDTKDRLHQSEKIKSFLNTHEGPRILCGDFNLLPNTKSMAILDKGMKNLIKEFDIKTTRNSLYRRKEKYADYMLVSKDIEVVDFKVIDSDISDHLPLILTVK